MILLFFTVLWNILILVIKEPENCGMFEPPKSESNIIGLVSHVFSRMVFDTNAAIFTQLDGFPGSSYSKSDVFYNPHKKIFLKVIVT